MSGGLAPAGSRFTAVQYQTDSQRKRAGEQGNLEGGTGGAASRTAGDGSETARWTVGRYTPKKPVGAIKEEA